jgi:hypothetical protein
MDIAKSLWTCGEDDNGREFLEDDDRINCVLPRKSFPELFYINELRRI